MLRESPSTEHREKEFRLIMQVPAAGLGMKPSRFPEPLKDVHSFSPTLWS